MSYCINRTVSISSDPSASPLVALPVVGFWRQKRLIERVEREIIEWIAARHCAGCIDV